MAEYTPQNRNVVRVAPASLVSGFTLLEVIVVVGILALIGSITLANHNRFNSVIVLKNLAYEVALSVREAQNRGVTADHAYGLHFNAGSKRQYLLFTDRDGSGGYNNTNEFIKTFNLRGGHTIREFCVGVGTPSEDCSTDATPLQTMNILFERPSFDAIVTAAYVGQPVSAYPPQAAITLQSTQGDTWTISVAPTGQISIVQ